MSIGNPAQSPEKFPEQGTFRMVPDAMWTDDELNDFDIRLWCVLGFYSRGRDHCEPTDKSIAAMMKVSPATVKRGLGRLERAGWIERRHDDQGDRSIFFSSEPLKKLDWFGSNLTRPLAQK